MQKSHINLLGYDRTALEQFFLARGEKPFRARQLFRRLHAQSGEAQPLLHYLKDLPKSLHPDLLATATADEMTSSAGLPATDDVHKLLFAIGQGEQIEAVIIGERRRMTLCVSSQAGCALACRFCLTGQQGLSRNLTSAEIITQLRSANRFLLSTQRRIISNVVMMGMGEPLLNLDAVLPALRIMTDSLAYELSSRRVTVSTAGIVPAIRRLRDECRVALAVSLHAPTDSLRNTLMPINHKYPLAMLMEACQHYIADRARAYITFEYVMLDGINDSMACAQDLVRLLRFIRCKVNLIPFNTFSGAPYQVSPRARILDFQARLLKGGVMTTIRRTRGNDIFAACGQLAGDVQARRRGLLDRSEAPLVRV